MPEEEEEEEEEDKEEEEEEEEDFIHHWKRRGDSSPENEMQFLPGISCFLWVFNLVIQYSARDKQVLLLLHMSGSIE